MGKSKLKGRKEKNRIIEKEIGVKVNCAQEEKDILFEFGCCTKKKKYSFDAFKETGNTYKNIYKEYLELIYAISNSNWPELSGRRKDVIGGFETLEISEFNCDITERYYGILSKDTKLHVFRFGQDYRMVGYKSLNCSRTIHILGFDLDFSLYDH